jgi:hypothetical protein
MAEIGRTYHVGVAKRLVVEWIRTDGAASVLNGWEGSDEDAIAAVLADPRETFVTCDCAKEPDGSCAGTTKLEAQTETGGET